VSVPAIAFYYFGFGAQRAPAAASFGPESAVAVTNEPARVDTSSAVSTHTAELCKREKRDFRQEEERKSARDGASTISCASDGWIRIFCAISNHDSTFSGIGNGFTVVGNDRL
jgi:hypothetical protein